AARLLAELAAVPDMHSVLINTGAAAALVNLGAQLAHESNKEDKTYSSMSAVPGTVAEMTEVEGERFTAAAVFGLASSDAGVNTILSTNDADAIVGMTHWAQSNDPILQRWGTGALARSVVSGRDSFQAVQKSGGLTILVAALTKDDGQSSCFAAGAIGRLVTADKEAGNSVFRHGAATQLLAMLTQDIKGQSLGLRSGRQRCALRAIIPCLGNTQFKAALQEADLRQVIHDLMTDEGFASDPELPSLAQQAVNRL
ncbi:hypothetical protein WJX73_003243, partial [Symbiochloris irregularis]